jgi:hypothetical protein
VGLGPKHGGRGEGGGGARGGGGGGGSADPKLLRERRTKLDSSGSLWSCSVECGEALALSLSLTSGGVRRGAGPVPVPDIRRSAERRWPTLGPTEECEPTECGEASKRLHILIT